MHVASYDQWLGHPLTELRYVKYFRFCEWHVLIPWGQWARIMHGVMFGRSSPGGGTIWTSTMFCIVHLPFSYSLLQQCKFKHCRAVGPTVIPSCEAEIFLSRNIVYKFWRMVIYDSGHCNFLVDAKNRHIHANISENTRPIFTKFSRLVDMCIGMIPYIWHSFCSRLGDVAMVTN